MRLFVKVYEYFLRDEKQVSCECLSHLLLFHFSVMHFLSSYIVLVYIRNAAFPELGRFPHWSVLA